MTWNQITTSTSPCWMYIDENKFMLLFLMLKLVSIVWSTLQISKHSLNTIKSTSIHWLMYTNCKKSVLSLILQILQCWHAWYHWIVSILRPMYADDQCSSISIETIDEFVLWPNPWKWKYTCKCRYYFYYY